MRPERYWTISFFLLACCASEPQVRSTYFDYSGQDGCAPANIGHRLGGDLPEYQDNTLEGMKGIEALQSSECFKNWEFDINQTQEVLILYHDIYLNERLVSDLSYGDIQPSPVKLADFVEQFAKVNVSKPVIIDLKNVTNKNFWPQLKEAAHSISRNGSIETWFIISRELAEYHTGICEFIGDDFDILLYQRGGPLCN